MAKILVLHEDADIRVQLASVLRAKGYEVIACDSIELAEMAVDHVDLFICGQLGKYSDGLLFAAERAMEDRKVLIISDRRKFSRIPFLGIQLLTHKEAMLKVVERALAGDSS